MAKFSYTIQHVPGKLLYTADALSRAPLPASTDDMTESDKVEYFVGSVTTCLPASSGRLQVYAAGQDSDSICTQVKEYCRKGWPEKKQKVASDIRPYWKVRESLTIANNLLVFNNRIVVPPSLRDETLKKIHTGHQGIERCRMRVRESVWWPGVIHQTAQMVQRCQQCAKEAHYRKEPMIKSELPDYPWQIIGTDLFELKGHQYLLTVDYLSRYPEIAKLTTTTSSAVISKLKDVFSRHGIPEIVRSDNGPQFSAQEFAEFANTYGFRHVTSSPKYPQSNGQIERIVQTMKNLLKNSEDPHLAVLSYRATPHPWCKLSPAELSMGRQIRTMVPVTDDHLIPTWSYLPRFQKINS